VPADIECLRSEERVDLIVALSHPAFRRMRSLQPKSKHRLAGQPLHGQPPESVDTPDIA